MLPYTTDIFNGVTVPPDSLPADPGLFRSTLAEAIQHWRQAGHRLVWLDIPAQRAALIPEAVALGFSFHHTAGDTLTLTSEPVPGDARRVSVDYPHLEDAVHPGGQGVGGYGQSPCDSCGRLG